MPSRILLQDAAITADWSQRALSHGQQCEPQADSCKQGKRISRQNLRRHSGTRQTPEPNSETSSDRDLLWLVLSDGNVEQANYEAVDRLLTIFGSFANAISATPAQLSAVGGLSMKDTLKVKAVQAAAVRLVRSDIEHRSALSGHDQVIDYLRASLAREGIEQFQVLFLNTKNTLICAEVLNRGTVNHVTAYPREIVSRALQLGATAIILAHNHPSGNSNPSEEDIVSTNHIVRAAAIFSIVVHDHFIVGAHEIISLRRLGLLLTMPVNNGALPIAERIDMKSWY